MLSYSHQNITQDDLEAVNNALQDEILTGGKKVEEFENALCKYLNVKYACVVNSATSALHLAYVALNVKDKIVLTTPLSFAATANAALTAGAKVEFIDIKNDGNINEEKLKERLEKSTKDIQAVSVVDFGGNSVELDFIKALCDKFGIALLDDASHALGSTFKNKKVGSEATLSVFSFHPIKPITTLEGGAITSNDKNLIDKVKLLRSHGIVKKDLWDSDMTELGYNYRLSDVACALGLSQLKKLDLNIQKREQIASFYDKEFKSNDFFDLIEIKPCKTSSRHLYAILLKDKFLAKKEKLFKDMLKAQIGVQVHYKPIYKFSFYKKIFSNLYLENAEKFYQQELSIPCHQEMTLQDAIFVKDTLLNWFEKEA